MLIFCFDNQLHLNPQQLHNQEQEESINFFLNNFNIN